MSIANSVKTMRLLFEEIMQDLPKAEKGNKSATQRVRVNTVAFEKTAKYYRRETLAIEKKEQEKISKKKVSNKKNSFQSSKKKK